MSGGHTRIVYQRPVGTRTYNTYGRGPYEIRPYDYSSAPEQDEWNRRALTGSGPHSGARLAYLRKAAEIDDARLKKERSESKASNLELLVKRQKSLLESINGPVRLEDDPNASYGNERDARGRLPPQREVPADPALGGLRGDLRDIAQDASAQREDIGGRLMRDLPRTVADHASVGALGGATASRLVNGLLTGASIPAADRRQVVGILRATIEQAGQDPEDVTPRQIRDAFPIALWSYQHTNP